MKDLLKYGSLLILLIFSFYYTDRVSNFIIYKSDLMKQIQRNKNKYEKESISAEVFEDYIIPGLNGLKINELDSYYKMKYDYVFSSSKYVYDEVSPNISLEQNKHLIINRGNKLKKGVSIIIQNNKNVKEYIESKNVVANIAINYESFDKNSELEQINIDKDFKKLDILLDKYKINTNICLVNDDNKDKCIKQGKYLVKPTYIIDNTSIIGLEITSGDILYIEDDLNLANFKLVLKTISYRNLEIMKLSKLISEKKNII